MVSIRNKNEKRHCRTCGVDITSHARYTRWTQCSLCYWKGRLEESPPLEKLLNERGGLKHKKRQDDQALQSLEEEKLTKERSLKASAPWWKKLLGMDSADDRLRELRVLVPKLWQEAYDAERHLEQVESSIKRVRHVRKRFDSAAWHAAVMHRREQEKSERKRDFDGRSTNAVADSYERDHFKIRKKDYKRGNPLDNHFRNSFVGQTIDAFNRCCLFCGSSHDLTLDHFGIPKNEGGNFVLALHNNSGIRMNVVVLCRSCNAAKGEIPFDQFFDASKLTTAIQCQERLLELALNDEVTMQVIRSWYRIHL